MILHITNGDSVSEPLKRLFPGDIAIPWRDCLHDGPVPPHLPLEELSEIRARFWAPHAAEYPEILASFRERDATLSRFAEFDEIVLWFEHDLYDQLQLIQVLGWFSTRSANLTLIQSDDYLGPMDDARLFALFPSRKPVTPKQLDLASRAWAAFRSPDPNELLGFLGPNDELPYLAAAFLRFCEEYPWVTDGLTRTQRKIQELKTAGVREPHALFAAWSMTEDPRWMGDDSFFRILDGANDRPMGWFWHPTRQLFEHRLS